MSRRTRRAFVAIVAVVAVAISLVVGYTLTRDQSSGADRAGADSTPVAAQDDVEIEAWDAERAGTEFLQTYVDDDGRVVRIDQGGDTVSEGQAYGMLIAAAVGDAEAFDQIWSWTRDNLQRPDALLSWRWEGGAVVDDEPASDADLDAARALALAADYFEESSYTDAARELGAAVLDLETVETELGRILTAGSWASLESPFSMNPSYPSPVATALLAEVLPDERWAELDEGTRAANAALMSDGTLPPDWAQVHTDGRVEAMPGIEGEGPDVRYGYDAARTPVRYAESCEPQDRDLAGTAVGALEGLDPLPVELDLGGSPLDEAEHPVGYAGRAAARAVSGDMDGAREDLASGDEVQQRAATYFGGAWAALARFILTTDRLGGCPLLDEDNSGGSSAALDVTEGEPGQPSRTADSSSPRPLSEGRPAQGQGPRSIPAGDVVPVRVSIPQIGVDSGLEDLVRSSQGVLQAPVEPESAGWFVDGTVPGERGPAVIAGHVDSGVAGAVFADLDQLQRGDEIAVEMSDGAVRTFAMTSSAVVPQAQFPTASVYGPVPDRQLRLITCHTFDPDNRDYVDNLVVFAVAVD